MKKILKIESIGYNPVYDIEVENAHHYVLFNDILSHNSGPKYTASVICLLSKRKEKDGTNFIGNVVHCKLDKSRFTKEGSTIDILIDFTKGLSTYYGILEMMVEAGLVKSTGTRFEFPHLETKVFRKEVAKNPELYFTQELLLKLDEVLQKKFLYGSVFQNSQELEEEEIDISEEGNDLLDKEEDLI